MEPYGVISFYLLFFNGDREPFEFISAY